MERRARDRRAGRRIAFSVLVLAGPKEATSLTRGRRASEVSYDVVDGGHYLSNENPEAVVQRLLPFLKRR